MPWQSLDPSQHSGPRRIEKWDTLSLEGSGLRPDSPVVEQTDDFPDFTREMVRVQWRDGDPIDLYIVRPKGVSRPPVVLYLYGYPREAVRFLDPNFCKTVTKDGYAAVGFSSMLTGQRYHDVPMKEWFVSDLQHSLIGTTHDVQMTLNYLEGRRGNFDMSRVGIFGEGSGGTIALLAAATDRRIKAVDVLDPWGDWPTWLGGSRVVPEAERADYTSPDFLNGIAALDPVVVLPRLTSTALRVQQSLWDSGAIPAASRERIAASVPPGAQLAQYRDIHDYSEKVGTNGKMLSWMYTSLAPGADRSGVNSPRSRIRAGIHDRERVRPERHCTVATEVAGTPAKGFAVPVSACCIFLPSSPDPVQAVHGPTCIMIGPDPDGPPYSGRLVLGST